MKRNRKRYALAALAAFAVATSSFAFAASDTVGSSSAGIGSGTVSGYTVSSVSWNLNDTNPANVDSVSFTLSSAATEVKARATGTGGTSLGGGWAACSGTGTGPYTCTLSGVTTLAVVGLEVASAS